MASISDYESVDSESPAESGSVTIGGNTGDDRLDVDPGSLSERERLILNHVVYVIRLLDECEGRARAMSVTDRALLTAVQHLFRDLSHSIAETIATEAKKINVGNRKRRGSKVKTRKASRKTP